jgi:DNA-directed RNA polymerase subunit M/transcription elongation factor TFIIS
VDAVRALQRVLYRCAKQQPERRFHALYDKVARSDVLSRAWAEVRANRGAPGIDDVSIDDVEAAGVESFLDELAEALRTCTYRPRPLRRVRIPKARSVGSHPAVGHPLICGCRCAVAGWSHRQPPNSAATAHGRTMPPVEVRQEAVMTSFRTICPNCLRRIAMSYRDIQLRLGDPAPTYEFTCPDCLGRVVKDADPSTVVVLVAADVHFPGAHPEQPGDGPAFTYDDILDFHALLATPDWFTRLLSPAA